MLRKFQNLKYCFLLVLLLHFLLLFSFSWVNFIEEEHQPPEMARETKADRVLPSYVYQEHPSEETVTAHPLAEKLAAKESSTARDGILKPEKTAEKTVALNQSNTKPQEAKTKGGAAHADPANLIADKETSKPLIKLLSRAAAANLFYPKSAQDFHITGVTSIKFFLTPEGVVSQVSLLQSSGSKLLDDAALYSISHMSPVHGVNLYLPTAKFLTVGIIFGG